MIAEESENLLNENFMTACAFDETKDAKYSVDQKKIKRRRKNENYACVTCTRLRRGEAKFCICWNSRKILFNWMICYLFPLKNLEKVPSNSKRKHIGMGKKSKTNEA